MKVKLFSATRIDELERDINAWLSACASGVDIKHTNFAAFDAGNVAFFVASVWYQVD